MYNIYPLFFYPINVFGTLTVTYTLQVTTSALDPHVQSVRLSGQLIVGLMCKT